MEDFIKKSIYPKTRRISNSQDFTITEKLDGSNLAIFKKDGDIYIATRTRIYNARRVVEKNLNPLKGLRGWLEEHLDNIEEEINEGSVAIGEWLGEGRLKYINRNFENRFHLFAKANINEEFLLENILYNQDLFKWVFTSNEIPTYISKVNIVKTLKNVDIETLDIIFKEYEEEVQDLVEGFIIVSPNDRDITKYVRRKNKELQDHKEG